MQFELLETYLDLIETRNFRLTAERLGTTQSTISARVKNLETQLGSALFIRGRSGASPTAAGLRFEPHARAIKASWGLARQELGTVDRFDGALRIAAQVSFSQNLLVDWMDRIRLELPRVALHVESDYSPQMINDISFGNLDIGLMYAPRFLPEIQFAQIFTQRFVLVSSSARKLADIKLNDYVRGGYTPAFEKAHSELLPELSRPRISVGLDILTIAHLRRNGGAGYVPQRIASELEKEGTVCSVDDAPPIVLPVFAATHIRRKSNRDVRRAFDLLKEISVHFGE